MTWERYGFIEYEITKNGYEMTKMVRSDLGSKLPGYLLPG